MEAPTFSNPAKDKTCQGLALLMTLIVLTLRARVTGSPHMPKQLTWQVFSQWGIWSGLSLAFTLLGPGGLTLAPIFAN